MSRHRATFSVTYPDEATARTVAESVGREVGEIDDDRSATDLSREGGTVMLEVDAADLVALRAASNTWLSLLGVAEGSIAVADTD